jgi:hypothetical protein
MLWWSTMDSATTLPSTRSLNARSSEQECGLFCTPLFRKNACHSAMESGTWHRWAYRWLNARSRRGKRWWTYFLHLLTHMPGREVTANANPITWHSACSIASTAEDHAASPACFPTEGGCFTYRYLLPFRLPQIPCSPQAQGIAPKSLISGWRVSK